MNDPFPPKSQTCARWANRILLLSLVGIAYLTLFPFQLHLAITQAHHSSPLLLGATAKPALGWARCPKLGTSAGSYNPVSPSGPAETIRGSDIVSRVWNGPFKNGRG